MNPFNAGGRYARNVKEIQNIFSEETYYTEMLVLELEFWHNLIIKLGDVLEDKIKNNVPVAMELINYISQKENQLKLDQEIQSLKEDIAKNGDIFYKSIKRKEKITNHDVAAVVEVLKDIIIGDEEGKIFNLLGWSADTDKYAASLVHFGLTSQDIVNVVYTRLVIAGNDYIKFELKKLKNSILKDQYIEVLGRSHGQLAVPMTWEHYNNVFKNRITAAESDLNSKSIELKFGNGTIGNNYSIAKLPINENSYRMACYKGLSNYMVEPQSIEIQSATFQTNYYPYIRKSMNALLDISLILLGFCQDMWYYASIGYLKSSTELSMFGSSTMPQKINPIQFENAEGNLKLAIGLIQTFQTNLAISRLQRDLSDITMMRNVGMVYGYLTQAISSISSGVKKFKINEEFVKKEISNNYQVNAEHLQLFYKLIGDSNGYHTIKEFIMHNPNWDKNCYEILLSDIYSKLENHD